MDKLEDFISKNREDIDTRIPSPDVWKGIRRNIGNRRLTFIRWSAAASVLILVGSALAVLNHRSNEGHLLPGREARIMKKNPQLVESEFYYNNLVKTLYDEASPLMVDYPDIKKELNDDMTQIDSICNDIRKDLKDNVSNQEVIEALIKNYRFKIQILNEMLEVLKEDQIPTKKTESHEL
jgi:hypothetical protein